MKKFYLLLYLLCNIYLLQATHIIGGSISYEYISGDEYKIKLEVLRDCYNSNPAAYFDDPAGIGVFDEQNNLVAELLIPHTTDDTISVNTSNNICIYPADVCIHKAIYESNINLPNIPGGYTLSYQRCCRSQIIQNLVDPLTQGMTFQTHLDPSMNNSSPIYNQDFPFAVFVGTPFVYDGSAYDMDGDSLAYELSTPKDGADQLNPQPQPPNAPPYTDLDFVSPTYSVNNMLGGNYPLTINPVTGEINAIPSALGVFQIAYAVKEFRNGQEIGTTYREFAFIVTNSPSNVSYNVNGDVLADGMLLDIGKVQLLERDISTDQLTIYDEQSIGNSGYNFENIPPGVFYFKAIPDSSSIYFNDFLPTYYDMGGFWYNANAMNQCDTTQDYRDIHLISSENILGERLMSGYIHEEFDNNIPVMDLPILLLNENNKIVQRKQTNQDGYFLFENLQNGIYRIFVDELNSSILNEFPVTIQLFENKEILLTQDLDRLLLNETTSLSNLQEIKSTIHISPNPIQDNMSMRIDLPHDDDISISIYNSLGQLEKTLFKNTYTPKGILKVNISFESFTSGLYLLEFKGSKIHEVSTFIKR